MKKKSMFLRILAAAVGLLIIIFLLTMLNGTVGNPISAYIATSKIRAYVEETYSEDNLIVNKATYNFKDSSYGCFVHSPTSEDTVFRVSVRKGRIEDDYPYEVGNKFTTLRRLEDALDKEVEEVIKAGFPYPIRLIGGKLQDDILIDDSSTGASATEASDTDIAPGLTLDMPYHIQELPGTIEVIVWTSTEKPSYEIMAQRMLELKKLMQKHDIPADCYSMSLEYPYHDENGELMPDIFDSLSVNEFPSEQLIDRPDLPQILEKYALEREMEGNKVKEEEMKNSIDIKPE